MENLKNTMRTSHKYYNENVPREYYDNGLIIYRIVQVNITIMDTRIQWYKLYRNKNKNE